MVQLTKKFKWSKTHKNHFLKKIKEYKFFSLFLVFSLHIIYTKSVSMNLTELFDAVKL